MINISLPNLLISLIKNSPPILNAIAESASSFTNEITGPSAALTTFKNEGPKNKPPIR